MCAACISSINQHCFEGERGMLIKQSKKYCKCSKTFGRDCMYQQASYEDALIRNHKIILHRFEMRASWNDPLSRPCSVEAETSRSRFEKNLMDELAFLKALNITVARVLSKKVSNEPPNSIFCTICITSYIHKYHSFRHTFKIAS